MDAISLPLFVVIHYASCFALFCCARGHWWIPCCMAPRHLRLRYSVFFSFLSSCRVNEVYSIYLYVLFKNDMIMKEKIKITSIQ